MDVQTENADPPSCESQSSGKIRKGFKLFGKRKPGNIFSIRSKGDGNNKSPVNKTKNLDGLSETAAPDVEQEPDKENGHEVSQAEMERGEDETLGEDGVLAAAHPHASISSACSAKSLSFLSLLKGSRKGGGDRQVQTISQPVARKRRGLKGLFNNVKFRSNDKEDQEEGPPSPLLMLSRTNSVEIIKEDLTLTPKSMPRSLDSPTAESLESNNSLTVQDSAATTPSETAAPQVTAGNVSTADKHVPPLPTESHLAPGDKSLSSLLADISSLLTFDSISGGGDIMADVEAEWGKASSGISAAATEVKPSSTCFIPPATSTSVSTAQTSPLAVLTTGTNKSYTPLTKTVSSSSPTAKSSTLTTPSVKPIPDSTPASGLSAKMITPTPTLATGKPSTTPQTTTSLSPPILSSPFTKTLSTSSSTSAVTTTSLNVQATERQTPSVSPTFTSTGSKLASEISAAPKTAPSVIKPVQSPPLALAKTTPVTHSPPSAVTDPQLPPAKLHAESNLSMPASLRLAAGESKAPVTVTQAENVITKPSSPAPVVPSKIVTVPSSVTSDFVSVSLSKPIFTSSPVELNQTTPSIVTLPNLYPSSTMTPITKAEQSPVPVPTPPSSLDKIPAKPLPEPVSFDKMTPAPTMTPAPRTPTPPALSQIIVSQSKTASPTEIQVSVSKDRSAPANVQVSQYKPPPPHAQIPISVSKDPPAPLKISQTETPSVPPKIPVSSSTDNSALVDTPSLVSKDSLIPAQISVSQAKAPPTPTPALCPVRSPPSPSPPWMSQAPTTAKVSGSRQVSMEEQLTSPGSTGSLGGQAVQSKTVELHNESWTSLQGPSREKRTPQVKASGLSKIPVVGGGRAGKIPVRESQPTDDEVRRDPPTPVLEEERPHFNSCDGLSKDKINDVRVGVPSSKCAQESQQPPQPKVLTSLPRDSKIPVKHGAHASQIPHEPPRTKIPVSKVPVRRVGKPAAAIGSTQIRK